LKDADTEELSIKLLKVKSELLDKDAQIEQLFSTLTAKGEEAGELSKKLIQMKNAILDQTLFEEHYLVVRVPFVEVSSQISEGQSP
jgi:hypothetical protein